MRQHAIIRWHLCWLGIIAICLVMLGFPQVVLSQTDASYSVNWYPDIAYYDGPDHNPDKHALDLFEPVGVVNAPVLMFVHGGGWDSGDKFLYSYIGRTFASRGYVTAVVNYRLSPEVTHPGHVQDIARAFRWVYENIASFSGDPNQIFLTGHSAGGHLVSLLALDDKYLSHEGLSTNLIKGVIPISGVYDVTALPDNLFTTAFTDDPDVRLDASPITHVHEGAPPFLILYGQFDYPTLDTQAQRFHDVLIEHDNVARLVEVRGKFHVTIVLSIGNEGDETTREILDFLGEHSTITPVEGDS